MKMKKVLSTRNLKTAHLKDANAQGIDIVVMEMIKITPVVSEEKKWQVSSFNPGTVVFTSKNAVKAVAVIKSDTKNNASWTVYCLQGATLNAVKENFYEAEIIATAANAATLAEQIINNEKKKEIIFFCGDRSRDELPGLLKASGFVVNEVIVYQTILAPVEVNETFDGILFFSPSAVESFFSLNRIDKKVVCFCIGATTGSELRKYTGNRMVTAAEPSEESMMSAVREWGEGRR